MSDEACAYWENGKSCHRDVVYVFDSIGGRRGPLCERHLDPKFWPVDLKERVAAARFSISAGTPEGR